jgi:competence protein ComEA
MKQFTISKKEKHGLIALGSVILTAVLLNLINSNKSNEVNTIKYEETITTPAQYPNQTDDVRSEPTKRLIIKTKVKDNSKKEYFDFDPNDLDKETAQKLGISSFAYKNLSNYISKGGQINSVEKFSKIYGIDNVLFEELKPYIKIKSLNAHSKIKNEEAKTNIVKIKDQKKEILPRSIEINSAVVSDFEELKGIGNVLATRIVKYRNSLGGYISVDQIKEVYGMPDSTYNNIKDKLICNGIINKININTASDSILSKHPYISQNEAKVIKKYLHQHDSIEDINQLKSIMSLDRAKLDKMSRYLAVN